VLRRAICASPFALVATVTLALESARQHRSSRSPAASFFVRSRSSTPIVSCTRLRVSKRGRGTNTSVDDYKDWATLSRSFSAMGVMMNSSPTLNGQGDPERAGAALVSSGIFSVFRPTIPRRGVVESD
jgi:hypothetical protein